MTGDQVGGPLTSCLTVITFEPSLRGRGVATAPRPLPDERLHDLMIDTVLAATRLTPSQSSQRNAAMSGRALP